ncbi:MAG: hypothetical protein Q7U10_11430 [Thermodesulfovibrionia bacterium]|nr:hypothetical protein [Thermodesulfovibrionia bacterium]
MEQKSLFGASKESLPYVECSPTGRSGPPSAACIKNNIKSFPTWIINGKRYEGIQKPDRLAEITGYTGK